jgi:sugar fermentation stimulation protein A
MRYDNIVEGRFIDRPNRFIAHCEIDGQVQVCHVKNTGRCRELLLPGVTVLLQHSDNPKRKTAYDLVAVYKGERLINMDANAPNAVFGEWLKGGGLGFVPELIKPECVHGDSRFDFYFEHQGRRCFAEVKGVTLEDGNVVRFPDAPTERGVKHLRGLAQCVKEGFDAYAVFVIQMRGVERFEPAWDKHKEFGLALQEAEKAGVRLIAVDCNVRPDSLEIAESVPISLVSP